MISTRAAVALTVLSLTAAAACEDDAPATNTVETPPTDTGGDGSGSPTEGNVGDITRTTPVAAGDDSVVQGDQPMLTSAVD